MSFTEWLMKTKGYTAKSAHDVESRMKRVYALIGKETVNENTFAELTRRASFSALSVSVKSQLKRAVTLYLEYPGNKNQ